MTTLDLNAIIARACHATPGPWGHVADTTTHGQEVHRIGSETTNSDVASVDRRSGEVTDADFIAHAREDIPALVSEVRHLTEERDTYRRDAESWRRYMASQAAIDNATPPRRPTIPFTPTHDKLTHPRTPHTKTTALAEAREADPTDDCD
ncbi:hypothetical protein [Frigoribacterium sp. VKM Ac-2530]|uniref:hypothetical protein n=1 Tax=Frigoribacterium sp. VKM Ac-2530 TaxID=2783822 RepID=UPI00188BCF07|nr:hypothetical protein [Frigoribacterium sp. VKM Ac-2530]MBF4578941.1 hypothetical protein [Frigoribacterium sp. VKM Ac-2530]